MQGALAEDQMRELWSQYKDEQSVDAQSRLIQLYLPLVDYVVGRIAIHMPRTVEVDELRSYGMFGLLDALQKFDIGRGLKFKTYAMWRIRGAIMDGLRQQDWLPRSIREKAKRIEEAYRCLQQEKLRSVCDEEVAEYLGMSVEELHRTLLDVAGATLTSIDEMIEDDESHQSSRHSFIVDEQITTPEENVDQMAEHEMLIRAIDLLPSKERTVVSLFYYEELTLTEIAAILHLSPSRISQLHSKAILRLRGTLSRLHAD